MKKCFIIIWISLALSADECSLDRFLGQYTRPFTILCISIGKDTSLHHLSEKYYESTFVFFESNHEDAIFNARGNNVLVLENSCSERVFEEIYGHDHFDVIYSTKENQFLEHLCDHLFLLKGTSLFYTCGKAKDISKSVVGVAFGRKYPLKSTFWSKDLYKNSEIMSDWRPGINLCSFIYFNGIYPERNEILEQYKQTDLTTLKDPFIWNMVLSGKRLEFIDQTENKPFSIDYYWINQLFEKLLFATPEEYRKLLEMDSGNFENSLFEYLRKKATLLN